VLTVSVVNVGTARSLMFSMLAAVALLKLVIVPDVVRFTIPLLVIPVIVPDPPRLSVSALVKFATAVEIFPAPLTVVVPLFVKVVIEQLPPMLSVHVEAFANDPAPAKAVPIVNVPLFVYEPLTVTLGIELVDDPLNVFAAPLNVWTPVLAVYVPLFMRFPAIPTVAAPDSVNVPLMVTSDPNESVAAAVSDNTPLLLIVTAPVKVFVPVAEFVVNVAVDPTPLPTVVVPVTVNANAPAVRVVPSPTVRLPPTARAAAVVTVTVDPLVNTRLPPIVALVRVFAPLPESVTLLKVYANGAIA